jgi:uncharacterized protein (TIGR02996 family)
MSIESGILAEVCERPEDDVPRLVYADWLEERGDAESTARAELIRVQCELARMKEEDGRWRELKRRERELLDEWQQVWARSLRKHFTRMEFRRGFVERITLKASRFVRQEKTLFQVAPIRHVALTDLSGDAAAVTQCSGLARLRSLELTNYIGASPDVIQALFVSPHLGNLAALSLNQTGIRHDALRALLAAAPQLARLEVLNLSDNYIQDAGARDVAGSSLLGQLTELHLAHNAIGQVGALALAGSPHAQRLEVLDLSGNSAIAEDGLTALLRLPRIRVLHFRNRRRRQGYLQERIPDRRLRLE